VQAYPAETTEAFCAGHAAAFAFFGGVPASILYDNTKLAVGRILGDGARQRTRVFSELQSHYLFADRFGRPGKGNDKGKVEGLVGLIRRNYLVPVPNAASFAALNEQLLADCRRRLGDRLRGHEATIGARLARDQACFHDLPVSPYDACEKRAGRVSSLSLVRYHGTDYSVPTAYGHREVLVRGYVDSVVFSCGADIIARHVRSYEREDFVFDPLHYLVPHAGNFDPMPPSRCQRLSYLGPLEGLRHGPVEVGDEALDPLLQVLLRGKTPAPQQFARQDREPNLDLVQPRRMLGGKMEADPVSLRPQESFPRHHRLQDPCLSLLTKVIVNPAY